MEYGGYIGEYLEIENSEFSFTINRIEQVESTSDFNAYKVYVDLFEKKVIDSIFNDKDALNHAIFKFEICITLSSLSSYNFNLYNFNIELLAINRVLEYFESLADADNYIDFINSICEFKNEKFRLFAGNTRIEEYISLRQYYLKEEK